MTALSPLADACPQCPPGDHPAVPPASVLAEPSGSLRAEYLHRACGAQWSCWWDAGAVDWSLSREGGQAA